MAIDLRNQRYKRRVLEAPYEICIERARYFTESFRQTEGEHPARRAAKAFAHTLANATLYLLDEERLVGNRSSKLVGAVLPIERGDTNTVLELELEALSTRDRHPYLITPADKRELQEEILPYWKGKTLRERKNELWKQHGLYFRPAFNPLSLYRRHRSLDLGRIRESLAFPDLSFRYASRGLRELLFNNIALVMNVFDVQGHLILGQRNVLAHGLRGIKEQALERRDRARQEGDDEALAFLDGVIISCDAVCAFADRFADEATRQAEAASDAARRQELLDIAARCRRVPFERPRDFREALQALWLTQTGALIAYGMTGIFAIGRFDQYLHPFYAADRAAGLIDDDEVVVLLEELLIKLSYNLLLLPYAGKQTGNELGADSCAPTVGGVGPDGEDAVNELSHLALTAFANIKSLGNSFTIRLSEKNPPAFWRAALSTYRETSGAALFSDEVTVPALVATGVSEADARDYGVIGCVEPTGDGDTFGCTSGNDISLAAALEMTLLDGELRVMGRRIGPRTGDARRLSSFDELMLAFERQVSFMVETVAEATRLKDRAYAEAFPCPFVSATLSGCVENGRDMTTGGARYNFSSISARGLGTTADSLAAIEQLVFDEGALTLAQLVAMLDRNFAGDEVWRQRLLNRAPKFGSDDDRADRIAQRLVDHFCSLVHAQQTERGGPFRPGFFSYGMHVFEGLLLGATPNGRRAGEPVSNSFSPANGSERHGPTAMLRSLAKINQRQIANGCAVNLKLLPSLFAGEEQLDKMVALVKGYFAQGGMELQPNVVSNETLRAAQADPDAYRDLAVRVSGYSALFTDLGEPLQNELIARTEFGRL